MGSSTHCIGFWFIPLQSNGAPYRPLDERLNAEAHQQKENDAPKTASCA
jgi:hypothetical protein